MPRPRRASVGGMQCPVDGRPLRSAFPALSRSAVARGVAHDPPPPVGTPFSLAAARRPPRRHAESPEGKLRGEATSGRWPAPGGRVPCPPPVRPGDWGRARTPRACWPPAWDFSSCARFPSSRRVPVGHLGRDAKPGRWPAPAEHPPGLLPVRHRKWGRARSPRARRHLPFGSGSAAPPPPARRVPGGQAYRWDAICPVDGRPLESASLAPPRKEGTPPGLDAPA